MEVSELSEKLRAELMTYELRVRDPILAHALWHDTFSNQERELLGNDLDAAWWTDGIHMMWVKAKGVSYIRAVIDLARHFNLMDQRTELRLRRATNEGMEFAEETLQEVSQQFMLVLVEGPPAAYWNGELIGIDWCQYTTLWQYIVDLCRSAKRGQPLDALTELGDYSQRDLVNRKSRLTNMENFPPDLRELIVPRNRGQVLQVPRDQIRIFVREESAVYREMV